MDFDIKTLINSHNDWLDRQAEEKPYLNQRIKAKLKAQPVKDPLSLRFRKTVITYGFLFLLLTLVNVLVIDMVKNKGSEQKDNYVAKAETFNPDYPGSISRAYTEVIQWEKQ